MATRDEVGVEAFRAWHRAEEAARRLSRRDFSGRQGRLLLGPEDVSMRKATRLIGSLLGLPDLPYVTFPPAGPGVRCAGADDVVRAVRLAREHDLAISVRGGHAVAGHGVVDGG